MKNTWRLIIVTTIFSLTCTGAALVALRAAAQSEPPRQSAPPVDETIPDDPVIAPDPEESADNNITFPVDI